MKLSQFISQLTKKESVPFVSDMDRDNVCEFPPGWVVPITEEIYFWFLDLLPPRWMSGADFVFAEGGNTLRLFWQERGGYYGLEMTEEESDTFAKLPGLRRYS